MVMDKIKIRIIGIGNCASLLVQGIESYRVSNKGGLLRPNLAGYHISDIQIVAAVDISENKVGKSIPEVFIIQISI
jgi:myo-inositol-1-phosphate synthase